MIASIRPGVSSGVGFSVDDLRYRALLVKTVLHQRSSPAGDLGATVIEPDEIAASY